MKELKFVRLRNGDDVVGMCDEDTNSVTITNPMYVEVESIPEEGKQFILMREYLPQSIIASRDITFKKSQIMYITNVRKEFVSEYEKVSEYFYEENVKIRSSMKSKEELSEKSENVLSILDALRGKKDKPIH